MEIHEIGTWGHQFDSAVLVLVRVEAVARVNEAGFDRQVAGNADHRAAVGHAGKSAKGVNSEVAGLDPENGLVDLA
jgi:hypothetical protein